MEIYDFFECYKVTLLSSKSNETPKDHDQAKRLNMFKKNTEHCSISNCYQSVHQKLEFHWSFLFFMRFAFIWIPLQNLCIEFAMICSSNAFNSSLFNCWFLWQTSRVNPICFMARVFEFFHSPIEFYYKKFF